MTEKELAIQFYQAAVEDAVRQYRSFFRAPLAEITDPLWRDLVSWAASLPAEKRELLIRFGRQAATDGVSTILGVLDGSTFLPNQSADFTLHFGNQSVPLSGTLQDSFLEAAETAEGHVKE